MCFVLVGDKEFSLGNWHLPRWSHYLIEDVHTQMCTEYIHETSEILWSGREAENHLVTPEEPEEPGNHVKRQSLGPNVMK